MNDEEWIGEVKKRNKGFTLIELIVTLAVVGVLVAGFVNFLFGTGTNVSWGPNGRIEQRCINGFMFVVDNRSGARQVMDEFGKGVRCQ